MVSLCFKGSCQCSCESECPVVCLNVFKDDQRPKSFMFCLCPFQPRPVTSISVVWSSVWILCLPRKIHSDISPTLPLILQRLKSGRLNSALCRQTDHCACTRRAAFKTNTVNKANEILGMIKRFLEIERNGFTIIQKYG